METTALSSAFAFSTFSWALFHTQGASPTRLDLALPGVRLLVCPVFSTILIFSVLVNALKRINPHKQKIKGTMYLSLKSDKWKMSEFFRAGPEVFIIRPSGFGPRTLSQFFTVSQLRIFTFLNCCVIISDLQ